MNQVQLMPLAQAGAEALFGGKGSGLAWLAEQGCAIPAGVVLPIDAFTQHLEAAGITHQASELFTDLSAGEAIDDQQLQTRCTVLQQAVISTPLTDTLQLALTDFWRQHQPQNPDVPLAVRSSAVGEDGQSASFAGQFDSVLHITDFDSLQCAIRKVWASLFSVHALRYSQHRQRLVSRMAVVIQQQVDAAISGVLFTRNPAGDGDEMLLEYCEGLADKLVSGEITPVSVVVGKHPYSNPSPSAGCGKSRASTPLSPRGGAPVRALSEAEGQERGQSINVTTSSSVIDVRVEDYTVPLQQLTQQTLQLEKAAGHPLDIEWCIDKNHQLFFVQCRPMTTMLQCSDAAAESVDRVGGELWSNANIAENFPKPVVPLLASFVPRGYAGYFCSLGIAFGIDRSHMDKADDAFAGLVGLQAGRLYYNLSKIFTVIHLVPGGPWLAQSFNLFTGAEGSPIPQSFRRPWYQQLWQAARIAFHVPRQFLWVKRRVGQFEQMIDQYAAQTLPETLPQLSAGGFALHLRCFLDIRENHWGNAALADTAAMVCYAALKALLQRWLPGPERAQLHNELLQGLPGLASAQPVEELWQLAQRIRHNSQVTGLLTEWSAAEAMQRLPTEFPVVWLAITAYLQQWGFRYSGELMLTQETPAENPLAILQLLQSYLQDDGVGPLQLSQQRAAQRDALTRDIAAILTPSGLLRRLPLPTRAAIFRRLLHATHGAIRLRERARMKQALLYTRLRHVSLALGQELVRAGFVKTRDDVFYLEIEEAITLAEQVAGAAKLPSADKQQLRDKIARRRAEMARNLTLNPPEQMTLLPSEKWHPAMSVMHEDNEAADSAQDILRGMSACGGKVSGQAAVLTDVTQIDSLIRGSILVTRQTDPGWAPVFFLVKGLVIERGGMLSHGAIIAREYGIPAVVGVARATELIADGEPLTVDGTNGLVRRAV